MSIHSSSRRLATALAVAAISLAPGAGVAEATQALGTDVAAPDQQAPAAGLDLRVPALGTDVAATDQQEPATPESGGDGAPVIILSLVAAASLGAAGLVTRNAVRARQRRPVAS